ncbi:casparian strip membrane protein 3 [Cornus florida]|uniref:casparian strip membrane protein 3 n=1 Tax=Cornus florida TaxID=4283 RepID=UPI002897A906|nr:casparian strip membrane protein 3 [Cornus florida]
MKSGPLEAGEVSKVSTPTKGVSRGVSIVDLILRIFAAIGTLASAASMGTSQETLPFVTQFVRFNAQYNDIDTFVLFVIVNSIVCAYLVIVSLPLSSFHIIRSGVRTSRLVLIILDTAMVSLLTAAASAAVTIVYLLHNGNASANWFPICQQFQNFCQTTSGALIGSFCSIVMFIILIPLSAFALSRH